LVLVVLVLLVAQTQRMVTTVMIAVFHLWSWRKVVEVVVRGLLMVSQDLVVAVAVVRVVRVDREGAVRSGLMAVVLWGKIAAAAAAGVWVASAGMEELLLVMAVMEHHQVYLEHLLIEEQAVLVVEGTVQTVQVRRLLVVMVVVVTVQVMQQEPLPEHPTRDQGVEGVRTRQGKNRTVQPVARGS
jgi:hypothetical protein